MSERTSLEGQQTDHGSLQTQTALVREEELGRRAFLGSGTLCPF